MAMERRKAVITQLSVTASNSKLFSISGSAILMDEIKNVPINEVVATMASMDSCLRVQLISEKIIVLLTKIETIISNLWAHIKKQVSGKKGVLISESFCLFIFNTRELIIY